MRSTTALAVAAALGSFILASGSPVAQSSNIPINLITGAAAVTAAPPVPTFGTAPAVQPDVAAAALGKSNVRNDCSFTVYLYSCNQQSCGAEVSISAGGTWSAPISSTVNDGVSIKIGKTAGEVQKPILQLEYTNANGLIYFDASEINGNPFGPYGFTLTDSAGLQQHCAPPGTECSWVYYSGETGTVYTVPNTDSIGMSLCSD